MQEEHNINLQHESEGALKIPSDLIEDLVDLQIPISENSDIEKVAEEEIKMPQELCDYLTFGTSNYSIVNALNFLKINAEYINSIDDDGNTPLMELIIGPDAVKYLLKHGANPNIQNNEGNTVLMMALKILKSLMTLSTFESFNALLEYGADVNLQDNQGNTALMMANTNCTKVLLKNNTNIDIKNNQNETALSLAVYKNEDEKTYLLLRHGADLSSLKEDPNISERMQILIRNAHIADKLLTEENFIPPENRTLENGDIIHIYGRVFHKVLNKLDKNEPLTPLETEKFQIASQVLKNTSIGLNYRYGNRYNNFESVDRALEVYANAGHKLMTNDQKHIDPEENRLSKKMLADAINSFTKFPEHIQKMECAKYNISFNKLQQQIGEYNFKMNPAIRASSNYSKIPNLFSKLADNILRIIGEFIGSPVISNAYKASIYRALKPIENNESKGTEK